MKIKLTFFYKILAILLLSVYAYSFAHIVHMSFDSVENCPHQESSHELCLLTLNVQKGATVITQKILEIFSFVIFVPFALYIIKLRKNNDIQRYGRENHSPPLLQELFARGILNTKVF